MAPNIPVGAAGEACTAPNCVTDAAACGCDAPKGEAVAAACDWLAPNGDAAAAEKLKPVLAAGEATAPACTAGEAVPKGAGAGVDVLAPNLNTCGLAATDAACAVPKENTGCDDGGAAAAAAGAWEGVEAPKEKTGAAGWGAAGVGLLFGAPKENTAGAAGDGATVGVPPNANGVVCDVSVFAMPNPAVWPGATVAGAVALYVNVGAEVTAVLSAPGVGVAPKVKVPTDVSAFCPNTNLGAPAAIGAATDSGAG